MKVVSLISVSIYEGLDSITMFLKSIEGLTGILLMTYSGPLAATLIPTVNMFPASS